MHTQGTPQTHLATPKDEGIRRTFWSVGLAVALTHCMLQSGGPLCLAEQIEFPFDDLVDSLLALDRKLVEMVLKWDAEWSFTIRVMWASRGSRGIGAEG
jgi:hypothetical protein